MVKNREQLIRTIEKILEEDKYKDRMDKVKEDLIYSFAESIAVNFISPRVTEEEIRDEIERSLDDYFIENRHEDKDNEEEESGVNFQVELGEDLMKLIREIPVSEEWKNEIYRIAIGFNNFGLYQSMQKECIATALYDICGTEMANYVMCEATKRTDIMTEKMFNMNYEAEKENKEEKKEEETSAKILQFHERPDNK